MAATLKLDGMEGTQCTTQANAWCDTKVFMEWVSSIFLPATQNRRSAANPIIVVMDNFFAHINPDVLMSLVKDHVFVVLLPPHSSHLLQPLDVGIMGPFKHWLHKAMHDERTRKDACNMSEPDLIKLIFNRTILSRHTKSGQPLSVWRSTFRSSNVHSAWQDSGLNPLDYNVVKGRCYIQDVEMDEGDVPPQEPTVQETRAAAEAARVERRQKRQRCDDGEIDEGDVEGQLRAIGRDHLSSSKAFDEDAYHLKAYELLKLVRKAEDVEAELELMAQAGGKECFEMTTQAVLHLDPREAGKKAKGMQSRIYTSVEAVAVEKAKQVLKHRGPDLKTCISKATSAVSDKLKSLKSKADIITSSARGVLAAYQSVVRSVEKARASAAEGKPKQTYEGIIAAAKHQGNAADKAAAGLNALSAARTAYKKARRAEEDRQKIISELHRLQDEAGVERTDYPDKATPDDHIPSVLERHSDKNREYISDIQKAVYNLDVLKDLAVEKKSAIAAGKKRARARPTADKENEAPGDIGGTEGGYVNEDADCQMVPDTYADMEELPPAKSPTHFRQALLERFPRWWEETGGNGQAATALANRVDQSEENVEHGDEDMAPASAGTHLAAAEAVPSTPDSVSTQPPDDWQVNGMDIPVEESGGSSL